MTRTLFQVGRRIAIAAVALLGAASSARAQSTLATPDYFGVSNWNNSPALAKFVNTLPGLCGISPWHGVDPATGNPMPGGTNELGQCLPLAAPMSFTGSDGVANDYYRIGLVQYQRQLHRDLPPTTLRGYIQLDANGNVPAGAVPQYLGPVIVAYRNQPTRIRFTNMLPLGAAGNLFIPTDTTYMGAGDGPLCADGTPATPTSTCVRATYGQNRATLHLHGGNTPWISDGTAHQWTAPAGDPSPYKKGVSARDVPDMSPTGDGEETFYWTNQQSGRLMFYHDHAYGITRLNVYAGEAAGFLLVDPAQETGLAAATVPGTFTATPDLAHLVPLVIQDKTFVNPATIATTDPTWDVARYGGAGALWFPHVYVPNQNPYDNSGANPVGRWDYGPWFWPPQNPASLVSPPVACTSTAYPGQSLTCPGTPNPSGTPEAFMDTMLVNGTIYPTMQIEPAAYRFQLLSAGNDRTLNLGLYYAATAAGVVCKGGAVADLSTCTEVSMVPATAPTATSATPLCTTAVPTSGAMLATAVLDASGNPVNGTGLPAACWPSSWPTDGRDGGVPDPTTAGPAIVQLGTEGGLLPNPVAIPSTPVNYEFNRRSITVLNVWTHGLLIGPAERADIVVDFSSVPAGSALILYNDAPAPVPAFDTRFDYYTGDPDQTSTGGAASTAAGFGPNTRTVMQFQVPVGATSTNATPFSFASLAAAQPALFAQTQDPMIVPESAFNAAYGTTAADKYVRISDTSISYWNGGPVGGLTLTSGGAGYTTAPTVTLSGGGGTGATATAALAPRAVASIMLTAAGSNYTSAPTVALTGGGGTGATASASLTPTTVRSFTLTAGGSGYTTAPTVTITGGGGTGATATATIRRGAVNSVTLVTAGTGYTSAPTVSFTGGGGTGAAARANLTPTSVASFTVTAGGAGYTSPPAVSVSGGGGTGAAGRAVLAPAAVASLTLVSGGTGYTSAPTVTFTGSATTAATAVATPPVMPILAKAIQELFTLDYGRMNATMGVELPFTNFLTQTTIPYGFADPPTELFRDGETQFWKVTHNGVDTHFIHFHLFSVQIINRVGWDGAIKPPDANEVGWKDTVRMNPLEDIIVALRPMHQTIPWPLPNSVRPLDVTQPVGFTSTMTFTNVDPTNQPATVVNDLTNFGNEYTWHCHILGHEENDMMRATSLVVPPVAPTIGTATLGGTNTRPTITVRWTNNALNQTALTLQRAAGTGAWTNVATLAPSATTWTDSTATGLARRTTYTYRVVANNVVGYTRAYTAPAAGYPHVQADSPPSAASNAVTTN